MNINNILSKAWTQIKAYLTNNYASKSHNHDSVYLGINATASKSTSNANGKELTDTIVKNISISGRTITVTKIDGSTYTLTTQDNNTTYSKLSQFTNDSGYITSSGSCNYATTSGNGVESSSTDYIRFKNGTQIVWGSTCFSDYSGRVNYPKAFTSNCPPCLCYGDNVRYDTFLSVYNWDNNGFSMARTDNGLCRINYVVVGNWK